jgi:hypothetical protein
MTNIEILSMVLFLIGSFPVTYFLMNILEPNKALVPSLFKTRDRQIFFGLIVLIPWFASAWFAYSSPDMQLWGFVFFLFIYAEFYFCFHTTRARNETIRKIFAIYHTIKQEQPEIDESILVLNTADIYFASRDFQGDKFLMIMEYIQGRMEKGFIKSVYDLPREIIPLEVLLKEKLEFRQGTRYAYSEKRLKKIENLAANGPSERSLKMRDAFIEHFAKFDKIFPSFSFVAFSRPDFTQSAVELIDVPVGIDENGESKEKIMAYFVDFPPYLAKKFGWLESQAEYFLLANLEYSRRNPGSFIATAVKEKIQLSDNEIVQIVSGKAEVSKKLIKEIEEHGIESIVEPSTKL